MDGIMETRIPNFTLRMANEGDSALILRFIIELADYEGLKDKVVATEAGVRDSIFHKKLAEVLIGEFEGEAVAFAVFYTPYSTFLGGGYLFLDDLYVREEYRARGFGREIFRCLAGLAVRRGQTRLDWYCFDWNNRSIAFYQGLGATLHKELLTFRLDGSALEKMAEE